MMCSIQNHFPVIKHISSRLKRNKYQSSAVESTSRAQALRLRISHGAFSQPAPITKLGQGGMVLPSKCRMIRWLRLFQEFPV